MRKNIVALLVCVISLSLLPAFAYADEDGFTITFDTGEYSAIAPVTIYPDDQNKTVPKPANPEGNDHCLEYWTKEGSGHIGAMRTDTKTKKSLPLRHVQEPGARV